MMVDFRYRTGCTASDWATLRPIAALRLLPEKPDVFVMRYSGMRASRFTFTGLLKVNPEPVR